MGVVYCRADGVELVVTLQKLFKLLDEEVLLNPTTDNSGTSVTLINGSFYTTHFCNVFHIFVLEHCSVRTLSLLFNQT
jgi:hypothetical protein